MRVATRAARIRFLGRLRGTERAAARGDRVRRLQRPGLIPMHPIQFSSDEAESLRRTFRSMAAGSRTMEEAAAKLVAHLYRNLGAPGEPPLALVRFFKTHRYLDLPESLRAVADRSMVEEAEPAFLRCLTLVATIGDRPEWCSRETSKGHQAIPLTSEEIVAAAPMIAQLIRQFGLSIASVVAPHSNLSMDTARTFGTFYVPEARGSADIPAQQEFVQPYGIRSVLGFGGLLPTADLWAVIMFSKAEIPQDVAESFRAIASATTVSLIPLARSVFGRRESRVELR